MFQHAMLWREILPEFFARLSVADRQSLKATCNGRMGCQRTMGIVLVEQITEIKCSSDIYLLDYFVYCCWLRA